MDQYLLLFFFFFKKKKKRKLLIIIISKWKRNTRKNEMGCCGDCLFMAKMRKRITSRKGQMSGKWTSMVLWVCTSMRKAGEWRTLQIGSPNRSVKRESFPLGPTSHLLSTSSTPTPSLLGSNSLTIIILSSAMLNNTNLNHPIPKSLLQFVSCCRGGFVYL